MAISIVWRYVAAHLCKLFSLTFFALLSFGLALKYKQIALVIMAGFSLKEGLIIVLTLLAQAVPHMINFSSLLAAFLLSYRFSQTGELPSLRASGFSLTKIFSPNYFILSLVTLINIFLIFEVIPYVNFISTEEATHTSSLNPLVLLRKGSLPFLEGAYVEMNIDNTDPSEANELLIALYHKGSERIALAFVDKLSYQKNSLKGENVSLITHLPYGGENFDSLIIDHQGEFQTPTSLFSALLKKISISKSSSIYSWYQLWNDPAIKHGKRIAIEKLSKSLYPLTLTFFGLSFGLFIGKRYKQRTLLNFTLLLLFYLFSFFFSKRSHLPFPLFCFASFLPHIVLLLFSSMRQINLSKGGE